MLKIDVYVDNFRISAAVENLTREVLVFKVEYYLSASDGDRGRYM